MTPSQSADTFRLNHGLPPDREPVATLARGLVDRNGAVVIDGQKLADGDAAEIERVNELLGGGSATIGQLSTIPSTLDATIGANEQAVIFGTLTVTGTLTIEGELRVGPWPF